MKIVFSKKALRVVSRYSGIDPISILSEAFEACLRRGVDVVYIKASRRKHILPDSLVEFTTEDGIMVGRIMDPAKTIYMSN